MGNIVVHKVATYRQVPWRNGRGKTLVLASEPIGAGDEFAWRLSIAPVERDGPFSRFDDCDRTLLLLQGNGLTLTHSNGTFDELNSRFAMARFPGDIETFATLQDGPIRDFNVMCNRHRCSASVTVLMYGSNALTINCDVLLACAADETVRVMSPSGSPVVLQEYELMQCDKPAEGRWAFTGGPVIAIQIHGKNKSGTI